MKKTTMFLILLCLALPVPSWAEHFLEALQIEGVLSVSVRGIHNRRV